MSLSEPLDTLMAPGKFYIEDAVSFGVPEEFHGMQDAVFRLDILS